MESRLPCDVKTSPQQLPDYLAGALDEAAARRARAAPRRLPRLPARRAKGSPRPGVRSATSPAPPPDSRAHARASRRDPCDRARAGLRQPRPRVLQWNNPAGQPACAATLVLAIGVVLGRDRDAARRGRSPDVTALHQELRDLRQMVSLSLMQQQSASERLQRRELQQQRRRARRRDRHGAAGHAEHDPNVNVRLASVDALKRFAERDVVRRAAVDALDTPDARRWCRWR